MNDYKKPLPKGIWLRVVGLAPDTTDEQLSAYLHSCGLDIPPENVCVKHHAYHTSAFIALSPDLLCELVKAKVGNSKVRVAVADQKPKAAA